MGDTKRGRERQGNVKREQRIEYELERELHADDTPPEPDSEPDEIDLELSD